MIIGSSMISKSFVKLVLLFLLSTSCYQCNVACFEPLPPVKRVVVVGGTHGNEYTGVWCIKAMHAQQEKIQKLYPSLQIETLLANEEAFLENKRFIDSDLNREFKSDTLCYIDDDEPDEIQIQDKEEEGLLASMESQRAKELDEILGSKCGDGSRDEIDVAIDLHSTTSNMGITLIINEGDNLMTQGAAYVAHQCDAKILIHSIPERDDRPTLSSAAKHGFTIEVGPVPQGILRHDAVQNTEKAMHALLEFFQRQNDGDDVQEELSKIYPIGSVPCFRTAPARRPGEISGKITWPCDPDNPNFPTLMVHESLQDQDFAILRVDDPLFVAPDGSITHYDGSHGDEVHVVFVNEAGYYYASSGTGIGVAVSSQYDVYTGELQEQTKQHEASNMQS